MWGYGLGYGFGFGLGEVGDRVRVRGGEVIHGRRPVILEALGKVGNRIRARAKARARAR